MVLTNLLIVNQFHQKVLKHVVRLTRWPPQFIKVFKMKTIPVLFNDSHNLHNPKTEFFNGKLVSYPETPERITRTLDHISNLDFLDLIDQDPNIDVKYLSEVHSEGLIDYLYTISKSSKSILNDEDNYYKVSHLQENDGYFYPSVFPTRKSMEKILESPGGYYGYYHFDNEAPIGEGTWSAILSSASLAYNASEIVLNGKSKSSYALCRPPGHHAGNDFVGGFCYLNNAALAANNLQKLGNVAIIDIDYHHGNGTQDIFWENPNILFCSLHANPEFEYPYYSGFSNERGGENAPNSNINIPLGKGCSGTEYLQSLQIALDQIHSFDPKSLVISVGFDAHQDDPLGLFDLSNTDFHAIGTKLAEMALPTVFVYEGGYNLERQGILTENLLRGFLGI